MSGSSCFSSSSSAVLQRATTPGHLGSGKLELQSCREFDVRRKGGEEERGGEKLQPSPLYFKWCSHIDYCSAQDTPRRGGGTFRSAGTLLKDPLGMFESRASSQWDHLCIKGPISSNIYFTAVLLTTLRVSHCFIKGLK